MSTIGQRIKRKRLSLGMSQTDLALKSGYRTKSTIAKIESDERAMKQSKIKAIADALQTTPGYIMGWEDPEEIEEATKQDSDFAKRITAYMELLSDSDRSSVMKYAEYLVRESRQEYKAGKHRKGDE